MKDLIEILIHSLFNKMDFNNVFLFFLDCELDLGQNHSKNGIYIIFVLSCTCKPSLNKFSVLELDTELLPPVYPGSRELTLHPSQLLGHN